VLTFDSKHFHFRVVETVISQVMPLRVTFPKSGSSNRPLSVRSFPNTNHVTKFFTGQSSHCSSHSTSTYPPSSTCPIWCTIHVLQCCHLPDNIVLCLQNGRGQGALISGHAREMNPFKIWICYRRQFSVCVCARVLDFMPFMR